MTLNNVAAVSSFVEGAPPGELADVIADIKALTVEEPRLLLSVDPAFQKYNEEQLATAKLPGSSQNVLVSSYNSLGSGRYYDVESQTSFAFDHPTQKASSAQSHSLESQHTDLIKSVLKSLSAHAREHYPASTYSVFPTSSDSTLAILLVANRYSPSNFWNGRWRSTYLYNPSTSSLTGTIKVDVHYYEDGNVRLTTSKPVPSASASNASEVVRQIATAEKKYQEELNRGFGQLSEGAFKGLRRQLPVTRQKVLWEKIGNYRLGQDIGGGRAR
ncbi:F-actin-capping protein subunit alpha [Hypocenomyce scalaris]|nr:F-actin-capping protein subunit alpha [Hypocenomyce scalaris]